MTRFTFRHPQYPIKIWVVMGCPQKDVLPYISTKAVPITLDDICHDADDYEEEIGKAVMFKNGCFLIWIRSLPENPLTLSNLVHEIFHTAYQIRTWIGAPYLTDESEEDWAYLISWLTENILKKHETHRRRGRGIGIVPDVTSQ
jgi:hypothetical protein